MMIDTSSDEAFRSTIRASIECHAPPELSDLADWSKLLLGGAHWWAYLEEMKTDVYKVWEAHLLEARLICAHWPSAYGGRDLPISQMAIFDEECLRANVPRVTREQGEAYVGPSVIVHGTEEQKRRFLAGIISGRDKYGQGFSEPDHGSDLAAVQARADIDGDRVVINGQKTWTTAAMHANVLFVLCRTDTGASRHRGLSYIIVPLEENEGRVTMRPIKQLNGESRFCETFFDNAEAPITNIIGGVNNGWRVAMTTLGNERAGRVHAKYLVYEKEFWNLHQVARSRGELSAETRSAFAHHYVKLKALQASAIRMAVKVNSGGDPGAEASLDKLGSSEYHQQFGEFAMRVLGADAMVLEDGGDYEPDVWQNLFLVGRAETIAAGTSEIQRNVLAQRFLGLPAEPVVK